MNRSYLCRVFLLVLLATWVAPPALGEAEDIVFSALDMSDGLSQNSIYSIIQDNRGFMWFGTQDGLNRFDGYGFTVYDHDPDRDDGLLGSRVWSSYEDEQGNLWFGSDAGLNRYDAAQDSFERFAYDPDDAASLAGKMVFAVHGAGDGFLWIGTGNGLSKLEIATREFTNYRHDANNGETLSDNNVTVVRAAGGGTVWVGTKSGGLNTLDTKTGKVIRYPIRTAEQDGVLSEEITSLAIDGEEALWIGTNKGLSRYDIANNVFTHYVANPADPHQLLSNIISALYEDSYGILWVATENGLSAYDRVKNTFSHYQHSAGDPGTLSYNHVMSVHESADGLLWAGTEASGVNKGNRSALFSHIKHDPFKVGRSLPDPIIWSIYDSEDTFWAGTHNGVSRYDKTQDSYHHYVHEPDNDNSLSHNRVNAIYQDPEGIVWFGTKGGLDKFDPATEEFTRIRSNADDPESLSDNNIRVILEDSRGNVWLGTDNGGINKIDGVTGRLKRYEYDSDNPDGISHFKTRAIREDSKGHIWIGTYGGLDKLNPDTDEFVHFAYAPENNRGLNAQIVFSVHEDKRGIIWIGTKGGGINRLDPESGEFKYYRRDEGLPNNVVYSILEDEDGFLWVSTNNGISRFHIYSGETLSFTNFYPEDGLQDREYNANSYFQNRETGQMFFGGINGYNSFRPSSIVEDTTEPPIYITEFRVFNQTVRVKPRNGTADSDSRQQLFLDEHISETNEITLSYKENAFSFEFSALHYVAPEQNQYAYMLEGLDEEWVQSGTRRFATYTNIGPGVYRFRVKGSNYNEAWNDEGASTIITVTPPIWQTWWFRLALSAALIALVLAAFSWRVRSIQSHNRALEDEVEVRTAELKDQKTSLETALAELHETKDALIESAHKAGMADTATGVLHNIGNILNNVNTTANLMNDCLHRSVVDKFVKANSLLRANIDNLEEFIVNGEEGKKLLNFYLKLEEPVLEEQEELRENAVRLLQRISAINEAIAVQQLYATGHKYEEELTIEGLVEDVLSMQSGSIERHRITVHRKFRPVPAFRIQKTKLVQILMNLYENARESMEEAGAEEKDITIELYEEGTNVVLKMTDTGMGFAPDHAEELFSYGFTTKQNGHGFGLHSCANYMTEMNGRIWAESPGPGKGATFVLEFLPGASCETPKPQDS